MKKLALSSTIGNPENPKTWSAAPYNLGNALRDLDIEIVGIDSSLFSRRDKYSLALGASLSGLPPGALSWSAKARRKRGEFVAKRAIALGVDHILCCGTHDCPQAGGIPYSVWVDDTWNRLRSVGGTPPWSEKALDQIDAMERKALDGARRILAFSEHVRQDAIEHYGQAPDKVIVVGCGSGPVEPYQGSKNYSEGHLLFVAKHAFEKKGGELVLRAFELIREERPQTSLVIVGSDELVAQLSNRPGISAYGWLEQDELDRLYHQAAILLQPMLIDPWGQVYLEAMKAKAIVLSLNRAALPELTDNGRLAVLVDEPDPVIIAKAVLNTYNRPEAELQMMADKAQLRTASRYKWSDVAQHVVSALKASN